MKTQIVKWGNDLAVRVPKPLAKKAELKEGDVLEIEATVGGIKFRRKEKVPSLAKLVAEINENNRYGETSTGSHVGKEFAE